MIVGNQRVFGVLRVVQQGHQDRQAVRLVQPARRDRHLHAHVRRRIVRQRLELFEHLRLRLRPSRPPPARPSCGSAASALASTLR